MTPSDAIPVTPRNTRFDLAAPVPAATDLGHVHLLAIGGAGMSAVARLLLGLGVPVSGSDAQDSPVLDALRALGATVHVGHDPAHLAGVDTVVVSSAVREDNPELAAARQRGLRVLHRSQGLASTMHGKHAVAVAGANGKTTTTAMLTEAVAHAGADPSFAIGGELTSAGTNARVGSGEAFVVEADESDGSFLVYRPDVAVVTNIQPDHLDFYGTFANVETAYADFARSVTAGGLLVACWDDAGSRALAERARAEGSRVVTYGFADGADLLVTDPEGEGLGSRATLVWSAAGAGAGEGPFDLVLAVPGRHNLLNAAAAFAAATVGLGLPPAGVLGGLAAFAGTRRRFEVKGEARGVTVVDDYAHNPGKVAAVVGTAAELVRATGAGGRLLVVFQPHLYSRTRDFAQAFADALAPADLVVLLDVYGAREDPMPGVSSDLVAEPLAARPGGPEVRRLGRPDEVADVVADVARAGDLVLTVGAGDVTTAGPLILLALDQP